MNYAEIIVSIISSVASSTASILATILAIRKSDNLTKYRMDKIEKKIESNQGEFTTFVARMYKAEEDLKIHDEKIKVANHRIDDLERKVNNQ